jgi:SAM-dependent methyltransferase
MDVHENRFGRGRHRDLFWLFHHLLEEPRPPVTGAAYLELGCGSVNPLSLGLVFLAAGASAYTAVDIEEVQDPARAARGMARLVDMLMADPSGILLDLPISRDQIQANLHDVDVAALRGGDLSGAGPRLNVVCSPASSLPSATGSVDVVLSNSFLEHVDDLDAVLAEIARVTAVGGFGVHQIDGVDHRSYADPDVGPHDFLRDPPAAMAHGSNRVRVLEFPEHFARHHFTVQQVLSRRIDITDDEIATFAEPWRSTPRETLETVQATMVLRRI